MGTHGPLRGTLEEAVGEIQATGGKAEAVAADLLNHDERGDLVDRASQFFGPIDILVNNAGIIDDGLLLRMTDEAWKNVIDTNLNGTFYCTRAVIRSMVRSRWGRVINVGSVVGLRGNVGQTNYTASKAGIIGFTYALAKEVATRNITVNTVTPGYVNTETVEGLTQKQKDMIMNWIPMQRFGEVDDIAGMIGYLASPRASYVTGQVISVDGGMAI